MQIPVTHLQMIFVLFVFVINSFRKRTGLRNSLYFSLQIRLLIRSSTILQQTTNEITANNLQHYPDHYPRTHVKAPNPKLSAHPSIHIPSGPPYTAREIFSGADVKHYQLKIQHGAAAPETDERATR